MPRLSLDTLLDRLVEESSDGTRYRDFGMVLRRLTLSAPVPEDTVLTDSEGRKWIAGPWEKSDPQPVRTEQLGKSTGAGEGLRLNWSGGEVELRIEVVVEAGGVWDTLRKDWRRHPVSPPDELNGKSWTDLGRAGRRVPCRNPIVVDLQESQIEAARWFAERLAAFRDQLFHLHAVALLFDDRRGGKTFACVLFVLCAGIEVAELDGLPTELWIVTQSHPARDEIDTLIRALLPVGWFTFRELPKRMYTLANGAKIHMKTTDDAESLRVGKADLVFMNEGALMPKAAYDILIRAVQDRGGFLLITTNRPKRQRGKWTVNLWDGAERETKDGKEPAVKLLKVPPSKNAAISQQARSSIIRAQRYALEDGEEEVDEGLAIELGEKLCCPPWDEAKHVRPLPQLGLEDVTSEVTKRLYGREYSHIVGGDFQQQCAGSAFKVFAPNKNFQVAELRLWAVDSWFLSAGGDEDDLIDVMETDGLMPGSALVIGDSSGHWQKGDHGYGPVSFATFRRRSWEITGPAQKKTDKGQFPKNPDVPQTVGRLLKFIAEDRLFATPKAKPLQLALRKCDARVDAYGNRRPKGKHAHLVDTVRYVVWWLLARPTQLVAVVPNYARR